MTVCYIHLTTGGGGDVTPRMFFRKSGLREGRTKKTSKVHRRADHWRAEGAGGWRKDPRSGPLRHVGSDDLQLYASYGGMKLSGTKRLRVFEDENAKLKRLLTETMWAMPA